MRLLNSNVIVHNYMCAIHPKYTKFIYMIGRPLYRKRLVQCLKCQSNFWCKLAHARSTVNHLTAITVQPLPRNLLWNRNLRSPSVQFWSHPLNFYFESLHLSLTSAYGIHAFSISTNASAFFDVSFTLSI